MSTDKRPRVNKPRVKKYTSVVIHKDSEKYGWYADDPVAGTYYYDGKVWSKKIKQEVNLDTYTVEDAINNLKEAVKGLSEGLQAGITVATYDECLESYVSGSRLATEEEIERVYAQISINTKAELKRKSDQKEKDLAWFKNNYPEFKIVEEE